MSDGKQGIGPRDAAQRARGGKLPRVHPHTAGTLLVHRVVPPPILDAVAELNRLALRKAVLAPLPRMH